MSSAYGLRITGIPPNPACLLLERYLYSALIESHAFSSTSTVPDGAIIRVAG